MTTPKSKIWRYTLLVLLFLGIGLQLSAQEFKVIKQKTESSITYIAQNPTDDEVYIRVQFSGYGFKTDYVNGTEQRIPPKTKKQVLAIVSFDPTKKRSIGAKYSLRKVRPIVKQPVQSSPKVEQPTPIVPPTPQVDSLAVGIVLFSREGCSRCTGAKDFLDRHDIPYQFHNISQSAKSKGLMWKKLRDAGHNSRVTLPVIIVNGKVHYNIKNLTDFLNGLKSIHKE